MSKQKSPEPRKARWWNPAWGWKVWAMVAAMLIPTLGFAVWVLSQAGGQTKIDPETLAMAGQSADGPVTAITGTEHTVYHANNPLPEPKTPREDRRLTLVWFTTTSCGECEQFNWLHKAASEKKDAFVFVEKDTGRDSGDERLGVNDVPTFVWLDSEGKELARSTSIADVDALAAEFARALAN